jgi:hypothetical protein
VKEGRAADRGAGKSLELPDLRGGFETATGVFDSLVKFVSIWGISGVNDEGRDVFAMVRPVRKLAV